MKCKGCKAIGGDRHPNDVTNYTNAKCMLGYETVIIDGMMCPIGECRKCRSWVELRIQQQKRGLSRTG